MFTGSGYARKGNNEKLKEIHGKKLDYLFDDTVMARGAIRYTGGSFIESLKQERVLDQARHRERQIILVWLDSFLEKNPGLHSLPINLVFATAPSEHELVANSEQAGNLLHTIGMFREALDRFAVDPGHALSRERPI